MRTTQKIVAAALLLCAVIFAAIPYLDAPDWEITVIDRYQHPVPGVEVREEAKDYSCEAEEHEGTLTSDQNGKVHFPPIYIHRNPLRCAIETGSELGAFVHGSFGRHTYSFPIGFNDSIVDEKGNVYDWKGSPDHVTSVLRLK